MAGYKRISTAKDLASLLSALRASFPVSKPMWQVVKDTKDGVIEANLFTDDWPDFTTVVSQEFAPRLSKVADLRFHSTRVDKVVQVLSAADLLKKIGDWQVIYYITDLDKEKADELNKTLVGTLSQQPEAKGKTLSLYQCPFWHVPEVSTENSVLPPPPGYVVKPLLLEHAQLVAEKWIADKRRYWYSWYLDITSYQQRLDFCKEMIKRFGAYAVFTEDNLSEPVAWSLRKSGGIHGAVYTNKEHRGLNLIWVTATHLSYDVIQKGGVVLGESPKQLNKVMEHCGYSHGLVLHEPDTSEAASKL